MFVAVAKPLDVIAPILRYSERKRDLNAIEVCQSSSRPVAPLEQIQAPLHLEDIADLQPRRIYQPLRSSREPWKKICISGFAHEVLVFENDSQV